MNDLQAGSFVVGTAGHIDHGKSTLVLALTKIDPTGWRRRSAGE